VKGVQTKRLPEGSLFYEIMGRETYAALNAVWFFRRQAKKPSPKKPKIIIAQVEGSGTAVVTEDVNDKSTPGIEKDAPIMLTSVMNSSGSPFCSPLAKTIVSPFVDDDESKGPAACALNV
jgi:hypothetical protein